MKNALKTLAIWAIIFVILVVVIQAIWENGNTRLAYSELIEKVDRGEVESIEIESEGDSAEVKLKNDNVKKQVNIPSVQSMMDSLNEDMRDGAVKVTEKPRSLFMVILSFLTPFGLLIMFALFWLFTMSGASASQNGGGKTMSFGKSRARMLTPNEKEKVMFDDVAGVDEEKGELEEIVEFL